MKLVRLTGIGILSGVLGVFLAEVAGLGFWGFVIAAAVSAIAGIKVVIE